MKKYLLPLLILSVSFPFLSQAQNIPKGRNTLGGGIEYSSIHTDEDIPNSRQRNLVIMPSIGTFYRQNHEAGINLTYNSGFYYNKNSKSKGFGAGVFLRQYFPFGKGFYVFTEEGISYLRSTTHNIDLNGVADQQTKSNSISLYFYPGVSYAFNRKFQIELGVPDLLNIGYTSTKETRVAYPQDGGGSTNYKTQNGSIHLGDLGWGLGSLSLGFKYFF